MNRVVNLAIIRAARQARADLPGIIADVEALVGTLPGNSPLRGPAGRLLAVAYALVEHVQGGLDDAR